MGVLLWMNEVNLVPFVYTKVGLFYSLIRDNQRRPILYAPLLYSVMSIID
jgi:hypothetical protein